MSHRRTTDIEALEVILSRRRLLSISAAATVSIPRASAARQATPQASADIDAFRSLCQLVVGFEDLPVGPLEQLHGLMLADEASAAGLQELLDAGEEDVISGFPSPDGFAARINILQFWYLGDFKGAPIENREERFAGLISYQALPYSTVPAVCKGHGYWAEDIELPDRP